MLRRLSEADRNALRTIIEKALAAAERDAPDGEPALTPPTALENPDPGDSPPDTAG
jgi:hypothetical protein